MSETARQELLGIVERIAVAPLADLDTALRSVSLGADERALVAASARDAIREQLLSRTIRVLLVELRAAAAAGALTAPGPEGRWAQWVAHATAPGYWDSVAGRYPTLAKRLHAVAGNRAAAALEFARRFAGDRAAVADLADADPELREVRFGAGDSHHDGRTVAVVTLAGGSVVYKPRSLAADQALGDLLATLLEGEPDATRIRVPAVRRAPGYGWAEFVEHRYCADDAETRAYYRGIGHWLAVARLLGATDLHAENVIAAGPVPVVVDCETLLTPQPPVPPSDFGDAVDRAAALLRGSVTRTGLLPGRSVRLGHRGADVSAAGALPDQQPSVTTTAVLDLGTDRARLAMVPAELQVRANQPSAAPAPARYWPTVVSAFTELSERLAGLDAAGDLAPLLEPLGRCPLRVVRRDTIVYTELTAMLWHPASLHDEPTAVGRARSLLVGNARVTPGAPTDPAEIEDEITAMLHGDVPLFTAPDPAGLAGSALARWRALDLSVDVQVVRCAVLSAYRDEDSEAAAVSLVPARIRTDDLDRRRRTAAADLVRRTVESAIHGDDGTVTWVAPSLSPTGIAVQPLALDLYSGLPGVAVLLAGYRREVAAGRADPVPDVDDLLAATVRSLTVVEDAVDADRVAVTDPRPEAPGCYVGLASRIWSWLLLSDLGAVDRRPALTRATAAAAQIPAATAADEFRDLLIGRAGAIVPLLRLTERTGERRWREHAVAVAAELDELAVRSPEGLRWPGLRSADGLGGFAHGSAGIGWALAVLADAVGDPRLRELAEGAFAFQDSLRTAEGWLDLRKPGKTAANWCHGCDGVGVLAADLHRRGGGTDPRWPELLGHAATATWAAGFGATHTLCHGDLGSWEVLDHAITAGVAPPGVTRDRVDAHVLSSLEEFGPRAAMTTDLFRPGLLSGMGGIAYQLLRLHPDCPLPSLLLPDPGGPPP